MPCSLEADLNRELRQWVFADPARRAAAGGFYERLFSIGNVLQDYERVVLEYLRSRFAPARTELVEVGVGYGLLSLLLAAAGFDVVAFEGDAGRFDAMVHLAASFAEREPALRENFHPVCGWFPDALVPAMLRNGRRNVFLATNIIHGVSADNQERILRAALRFDDVLIDVARFGVPRDEPGAADAFWQQLSSRFEPVQAVLRRGSTEIWHFVPRPGAAAAATGAVGRIVLRLQPPFAPEGAAAWYAPLPAELHKLTDTDENPARSRLRLFENDTEIGPGHMMHRRIRDAGGGAYSCWKTGLWFSTTDGSNPNTNGRTYTINLAEDC